MIVAERKSFEEIKNRFKVTKKKKLKKTIDELKNKKIFFESDGKFLSLSLDLKKYKNNYFFKTL